MRIAHFSFDHPHRCYRFEVITLGPQHPFRDEGGGWGFRGFPQFESLATTVVLSVQYQSAKDKKIRHAHMKCGHRPSTGQLAHLHMHTSTTV
jgi:hypothetical protein